MCEWVSIFRVQRCHKVQEESQLRWGFLCIGFPKRSRPYCMFRDMPAFKEHLFDLNDSACSNKLIAQTVYNLLDQDPLLAREHTPAKGSYATNSPYIHSITRMNTYIITSHIHTHAHHTHTHMRITHTRTHTQAHTHTNSHTHEHQNTYENTYHT